MNASEKILNSNFVIECYNNQNVYPIIPQPAHIGLPEAFHKIICQNEKYIQVLQRAALVAPTDAAVFISGSSGVGKELIAEAIHKVSNRAKNAMVKVNCAAIPETLFESELFGYEKGAFTGASSGGKKGKFEMANGGTIFLDEIGEMPLNMQVKFLRVLQEKEVEKIGGTKSIKTDFRLIAATNRNLEKMVENGEFREDLYYRLNVIQLDIPSLRERPDDIPVLAFSFIRRLQESYHKNISLSQSALKALMDYHWPGNVRELNNMIEQAFILCNKPIIDLPDLPGRIRKAINNSVVAIGQTTCYNLNEIIEKTERETIIAVMRITKNNKTRAIDMLGISRRCFYQKLEKYQIMEC